MWARSNLEGCPTAVSLVFSLLGRRGCLAQVEAADLLHRDESVPGREREGQASVEGSPFEPFGLCKWKTSDFAFEGFVLVFSGTWLTQKGLPGSLNNWILVESALQLVILRLWARLAGKPLLL